MLIKSFAIKPKDRWLNESLGLQKHSLKFSLIVLLTFYFSKSKQILNL